MSSSGFSFVIVSTLYCILEMTSRLNIQIDVICTLQLNKTIKEELQHTHLH